MAITKFPAFLTLEHQDDNKARASFLAAVDSITGDANRKLDAFSKEASRQLTSALSVNRNSVGSLDLGVEEMRAAAQAQQARAVAAREVANATRLAAKEEQDYSRQTRMAVIATEALAKEEERAAREAISHAAALDQVQQRLNRQASGTQAVVLATREGTTANRMMANSTRALRTASVQAGQQLQDIAISLEGGQRATTVFAQQLPQLAFALSALEGSANKTHNRIGQFATFLSGPWGFAVLGAGIVLGNLISRFFETEEASKKASKGFETQADRLDLLKHSYDEVIKATREFNREQEAARQTALAAAGAIAAKTAENIKSALATRQNLQAELDAALASGSQRRWNPQTRSYDVVQEGYRATELRAQMKTNLDEIRDLTNAAQNATFNVADEFAKRATDQVYDIQQRYKGLRDEVTKTYTTQAEQTRELIRLRREERAEIEKAQAAERGRRSASGGPSASAQASLGDMTALIKQLFPGARITSTTGGRHTKGSDHYAGRAIDFVPAGGMGQYTTAQVERILEEAGVDIRRNARGTKQLFGPGRGAKTPNDHADHFHVAWQGSAPDPEKVAASAEKARQKLEEFGNRASESIARINERFDEQPRLIDTATQSTRQLDAIIADLEERKPAGFEQMIADAERAKRTIGEALVRPFEDMARESSRQLEIQRMILSGREKEATALQEIWRLESTLGPLTDDQRRAVQDIVIARENELEMMDRLHEMQSAYLDATRSVRSEVEAILSGQGKFSNFKQIFKQLQGRVLTEQLFGDMFRNFDQWVKQNTGLGKATDQFTDATERAGDAALSFADALDRAISRISGSTVGTTAGGSTLEQQFDAVLGVGAAVSGILSGRGGGGAIPYGTGQTAANDNGEIIVERTRPSANAITVNSLSPNAYFDEMAKRLGRSMTDALNGAFDTTFFSRFSGVLGGALGGYASGGVPGGIIGALKGIEGLPDGISKALGKAGDGAATGTAVAGISKALGIKMSSTGAQIGGAIGSFLPIPGGQIIGAIAGGIIGKLFGGHKSGSATIGAVDGALGIAGTGGNKGSFIKAASGAGGAVTTAIDRIADALNAEVNAALGNVTIGLRDGKWRVNTSGTSLKTGKGAVNFGKEGQAEAVAYATADLIRDGVLTGLRQSTLNLLQKAGGDLDAQIEKAVNFEGVFAALKAINDPVGAAIDTLDKEFRRLRKIFDEAGATTEEYANLEELYNSKRAEAIKQARSQAMGSLMNLMDELTIGDSGLSIRSRIEAAQAKYDPLASRVAAGDVTAYDDFSDAASTLLALTRELYGSTGDYWSLFDSIKGLTQGALDAQQSIADAAAEGGGLFGDGSTSESTVPADDTASVTSAIAGQTDALIAALGGQLQAINDNQIATAQLLQQYLAANGTAAAFSFAGNF